MFGQTHSTVQDTTIRTTPADAIALGGARPDEAVGGRARRRGERMVHRRLLWRLAVDDAGLAHGATRMARLWNFSVEIARVCQRAEQLDSSYFAYFHIGRHVYGHSLNQR